MSLDERERREITELASAMADGRTTPDQLRRLEEVLRASPGARAFYVRFMDVSAGAAWAAHAEPAATLPPAARARRRRAGWLITAAAAALAIGLWVLWAGQRGGADSVKPGDAGTGGIALLSTAVNVEWSQEPQHVGNVLKPGWIHLKAGLAQIDFLDGASVWLEGPAEFRLDTAEKGYCASGKLLARVPHGSQGFEVDSPLLTVVDKGTQFGVEVTPDKVAVHVFVGAVELRTQACAPSLLAAGDGMWVDAAGAMRPMRADPHVFDHFGPAGLSGFGPDWSAPHEHGPGGPGGAEFEHGPMPERGPMGDWKGADPLEFFKGILGVDDGRWELLKPRLSAYAAAQMDLRGIGMDASGHPSTAVGQAQMALWLALASKDQEATEEELAKDLKALRDARLDARAKMGVAEEELRHALDAREEALLVTAGFLQ